jgi:hypothetical protein
MFNCPGFLRYKIAAKTMRVIAKESNLSDYNRNLTLTAVANCSHEQLWVTNLSSFTQYHSICKLTCKSINLLTNNCIMNNPRRIIIWVLLIIALLSLLTLYGIQHKIDPILLWIDRIIIIIPGLVILLLFFFWAAKTGKHRIWKAVTGIALSIGVSAFTYRKYLDQVRGYIDKMEEKLTFTLYILVATALIIISILTIRKKVKR